ncbi:MAG TPA: UDP-glucuronic acid decarboxylase family protein [Rhabdochlamydiaceae bacterium]|nr:UDP-glucuronic acid decarboxylase family protein [Rhabdochlamydiaceae bacterium]
MKTSDVRMWKKWSNIILVLACLFMQLNFLQAIEGQKCSLVTGGAGFLGSNLCDHLLEEGYEVICLDDLSTGSRANIEHLLTNPLFTFIQHDITKPLDLDKPLDEIYNLACAASPPHYQKDPIQTIKTNFFGALFVLELAKKWNAKVFQASTSEVYGDPTMHPQKESYWGNVNPIGIRSCYDEGKRSAETLFFDYHRAYGTKIKVGRIFNTYGPRMSPDDGRVVSNFIVQALKNDPITMYGNGEQTRSFCYVSDLIDAIRALMNTTEEFTGPVNIGNPGEFTMLELASKVISLTNSNSQVVFKPLPLDDPKQRRPDLTLANQVLKWGPKVSLDEGLKPTIVYFSERLGL